MRAKENAGRAILRDRWQTLGSERYAEQTSCCKRGTLSEASSESVFDDLDDELRLRGWVREDSEGGLAPCASHIVSRSDRYQCNP